MAKKQSAMTEGQSSDGGPVSEYTGIVPEHRCAAFDEWCDAAGIPTGRYDDASLALLFSMSERLNALETKIHGASV